MTVGKMINLLVVVHVVVDVRFEGLRGPEQVPVMRLRILPTICLKNGLDQFCLTFDQLIIHFGTFIVLIVVDGSFLKVQSALTLSHKLKINHYVTYN